jgi:hypothetical protein
MDAIFDWCVQILLLLAAQLGITYKEINVWVFVIVWPILSLVMLAIIIRQQIVIQRLRKSK